MSIISVLVVYMEPTHEKRALRFLQTALFKCACEVKGHLSVWVYRSLFEAVSEVPCMPPPHTHTRTVAILAVLRMRNGPY